MESKAKAPKKATPLKPYKGYKKFTILKEHSNHKKGSEVELTYEVYQIFKKLKLVK
jgi:hypothetical protein